VAMIAPALQPEIVRLWQEGLPTKHIARHLGLHNPHFVRTYT
jgi:hypothetical protein